MCKTNKQKRKSEIYQVLYIIIAKTRKRQGEMIKYFVLARFVLVRNIFKCSNTIKNIRVGVVYDLSCLFNIPSYSKRHGDDTNVVVRFL